MELDAPQVLIVAEFPPSPVRSTRKAREGVVWKRQSRAPPFRLRSLDLQKELQGDRPSSSLPSLSFPERQKSIKTPRSRSTLPTLPNENEYSFCLSYPSLPSRNMSPISTSGGSAVHHLSPHQDISPKAKDAKNSRFFDGFREPFERTIDDQRNVWHPALEFFFSPTPVRL